MSLYYARMLRAPAGDDGDTGGGGGSTEIETTPGAEAAETAGELDPWSEKPTSDDSKPDTKTTETPESKDQTQQVVSQEKKLTQGEQTQATQQQKPVEQAPAQQQQQQQSATQKPRDKSWSEMSPQELDKVTQRFVVDSKFMNSLGFIDASPEQIQGMQQFADGVAAHALVMANKMIETQVERAMSRVSPIVSQYESAQKEEIKNGFFESHPHLRGQDELLATIANQIDEKGKSGEQVIRELADRATAILQKAGVNISAAPTSQTVQKSAVPKPNSLSGTGRSSAQTTASNVKQGLQNEGDIWGD